ncbi:hypothetical protein AVEN_197504-1 [Araneus ventricosus]|uniref:Uncharacterized protein n=1 Tax=Araneus ventricosus TaxID=182803 RepID=A0A4Y2BRZ1_ARAVE|nr:hypothetical protein AVEN_197504-1 [Araneus ventricosus]
MARIRSPSNQLCPAKCNTVGEVKVAPVAGETKIGVKKLDEDPGMQTLGETGVSNLFMPNRHSTTLEYTSSSRSSLTVYQDRYNNAGNKKERSPIYTAVDDERKKHLYITVQTDD